MMDTEEFAAWSWVGLATIAAWAGAASEMAVARAMDAATPMDPLRERFREKPFQHVRWFLTDNS
ncbi:hypothetical protein [Corynebacterium qintianiae]|uniref:hypothetical protein n=1 Tax=Corynebacterium qintianiae TaxID=2709392 RepID=UPI0020183379|nr:hypothetical protein [Corynebacterium qintianiae]